MDGVGNNCYMIVKIKSGPEALLLHEQNFKMVKHHFIVRDYSGETVFKLSRVFCSPGSALGCCRHLTPSWHRLLFSSCFLQIP